jgi:hypothetical protein
MKLELNENLIEEILAVDAEFDNNATDDTWEHAAELIGVLAEKINEQK